MAEKKKGVKGKITQTAEQTAAVLPPVETAANGESAVEAEVKPVRKRKSSAAWEEKPAEIKEESSAAGEDTVSAALAAKTPFTPEQTLFALEVFCELGLLRISGGLVCVTGKRSELNRSALYRAVCALKEKQ